MQRTQTGDKDGGLELTTFTTILSSEMKVWLWLAEFAMSPWEGGGRNQTSTGACLVLPHWSSRTVYSLFITGKWKNTKSSKIDCRNFIFFQFDGGTFKSTFKGFVLFHLPVKNESLLYVVP